MRFLRFAFPLVSFFLLTGRSYPLKQVSTPSCRFLTRDQHTASCKEPLPIIKNADYATYANNRTYRTVYTTLRHSSYNYNRDYGMGIHPGVDIATAEGTPVTSMGDGIVIYASQNGGRGGLVMVQHTWGTKTIRAVYGHLSVIAVKKGQKIKEGDLIGLVGTTWDSTWPHLHFQINTTEPEDDKYPRYPNGCDRDGPSAACLKGIDDHTMDPIVFLESQWKEDQTKPTTIDPSTIMSDQDLSISNEQLFQQYFTRQLVGYRLPTVIHRGDVASIGLIVRETKSGVRYEGNLPTSVTITYPTDLVDVLPDTFSHTSNLDSMSIIPKATGSGVLHVMVGEATGAKDVLDIPITIADEVMQNTYSATWLSIGKGKFALGYMTSNGPNSQRFIKNPFAGQVTIAVESGKGCLLKRDPTTGKISVASCVDADNAVSVTYDQTIQGLLVWEWLTPGRVSIWYQGRQISQ